MELLLERLVKDYISFEPAVDPTLPMLAFMQNYDETVLHSYSNDPLYAILSQALYPVHTPQESVGFKKLELSLNDLKKYTICQKCILTYQDLHSSVVDFELQMAIGAKTLLTPFTGSRKSITAEITSRQEAITIVKAYLEFRGQVMEELIFFTDILIKDSYVKYIEQEREKVCNFFDSIVENDLIKALGFFIKDDISNNKCFLVKLGAINDVLNIGGEDFTLDDAPLVVTLLAPKSFDQEVIIPVSEEVYNMLYAYENELGYKGIGLLLDSCKFDFELSDPLFNEVALCLHRDGGDLVDTLEKALQTAQLLLKK